MLVSGERHAGPIERPPLMPESLAAHRPFRSRHSSIVRVDSFRDTPDLGLALMTVYLVSGSTYFAFARARRRNGWGVAALLTAAFVAWITVVNLFYLLTQIVVAADDCSVGDRRVASCAFLAARRARSEACS